MEIQNNKIFKYIKKWIRPDNYVGSTFENYYIGLARTRDSDVLENCNFSLMLEKLGGESKTVIVTRSSHWACGWVEEILVHKSNKKKLSILNCLMKRYKEYPVLDDFEYSDAQSTYAQETAMFYKEEFRKEFLKFLDLKEKPKGITLKDIDHLCRYIYENDVYANGDQDSWVRFDNENYIAEFLDSYPNSKAGCLIERKNTIKNNSIYKQFTITGEVD